MTGFRACGTTHPLARNRLTASVSRAGFACVERVDKNPCSKCLSRIPRLAPRTPYERGGTADVLGPRRPSCSVAPPHAPQTILGRSNQSQMGGTNAIAAQSSMMEATNPWHQLLFNVFR